VLWNCQNCVFWTIYIIKTPFSPSTCYIQRGMFGVTYLICKLIINNALETILQPHGFWAQLVGWCHSTRCGSPHILTWVTVRCYFHLSVRVYLALQQYFVAHGRVNQQVHHMAPVAYSIRQKHQCRCQKLNQSHSCTKQKCYNYTIHALVSKLIISIPQIQDLFDIFLVSIFFHCKVFQSCC
jgi:hypothetical protein